MRGMELLQQAHEELKARGLIENYLLLPGAVEVEFAENHRALQYQVKKQLSERNE